MGLLDIIFGRGKSGANPPPKAPPGEINRDDIKIPAIWLGRYQNASTLSRLGGLPNLPNNIDWPRQTSSGTPLHFLAQIDLATLPVTPLDARKENVRLPREGILFFFADIEEEMLWDFEERGGTHASTRVIYALNAGPERQPPEDLPEVGHEFGKPSGGYAAGLTVFPTNTVVPYVIDTFPGLQGEDRRRADRMTLSSIERAKGEPLPVLDRFKQRDESYVESAVWLQHRDQTGNVEQFVRLARHQMLGAATDIQGTAEGARKNGDVLLLQLDSDQGVDQSFMFCDMGMAQFWIRPEDLAKGRFDKAWGTTEGG